MAQLFSVIAISIALSLSYAYFGVKLLKARRDNDELKYKLDKAKDLLRKGALPSEAEESKEEEPEEENPGPELKVGGEVEIDLEGRRIRGKIESIAASSKEGKPGFSFRAFGDKNTLWLSHAYSGLVVIEDEDEEPAAPGEEAVGTDE